MSQNIWWEPEFQAKTPIAGQYVVRPPYNKGKTYHKRGDVLRELADVNKAHKRHADLAKMHEALAKDFQQRSRELLKEARRKGITLTEIGKVLGVTSKAVASRVKTAKRRKRKKNSVG